jgi:hypothetical protein
MFEVIDNLLSESDLREIQKIMMSREFPWFVNNEVTTSGVRRGYDFYMTHLFFFNYMRNSPYFYLILPILNFLQPSAVARIKGNFYPNQNKLFEHEMHIDDDSSKGALFYINTNDGYTKLQDGTKIKSIENRLLIFDSFLPHCSTNCTNDYGRYNINFNYYL